MFLPLFEDELEIRQKDFDQWVQRYLTAKEAVEIIRQRETEPTNSLARFVFSRRSAGKPYAA